MACSTSSSDGSTNTPTADQAADAARSVVDDQRRLGGRDVAFARLPEDEAEQVGARVERDARLGQRAQSAHLDQRHAHCARGRSVSGLRRRVDQARAA